MAGITSYATLVTAIEEWMDRADLSGQSDTLIQLCEARLRRELQPFLSETSTNVTVTSGVGTLPADMDSIRLVIYDGGELMQVPPAQGRQFKNEDGTAIEPSAFSLEAGQIYLWPAVSVTVTVLYQPKLSGLTSSNTTNHILANHPDVYLFGALMYAEGYTMNDSRAANFEALWSGALDQVKAYLSRQRRVKVRYPGPAVIA